MLEHLNLWIVPWSVYQTGRAVAHPGNPPPRWAVLDSASREFLGLVRMQHRWADSWLGWLTQTVVEVFETQDQSFLLRTWRRWGAWHVCDAEGRFAGSIRGTDVRDRLGLPMAVISTAPDKQSGSWQSPQARELGSFSSADGGILVRFSPELLDDDPFIRMVLLATLLRIE